MYRTVTEPLTYDNIDYLGVNFVSPLPLNILEKLPLAHPVIAVSPKNISGRRLAHLCRIFKRSYLLKETNTHNELLNIGY